MKIFSVAPGKTPHPMGIAVNLLLLCVIVVGAFWLVLAAVGYRFDFTFLAVLHLRLKTGFIMTVYLSLASLAVSLMIGLISALLQNSRILLLRYLSGLYVMFIRGTPLIMQIYLFYYLVADALSLGSRFIAGVIVLSLFEGAYIAEIIRGSLLSIESTQLEAAKAVGFTEKQTALHVILPQMVARTLPALTGQFASIIKDSSLLCIIAVTELTQTMREITSGNFRIIEGFLFLGLLYLCLTLPISIISKRIERRFDYES